MDGQDQGGTEVPNFGALDIFGHQLTCLFATSMKAKRRVCGERGSAQIAYTKLVQQTYLPRSSAKVYGISLQSVLLLAHHSTNCPRTALGSTKVTRLPRR